MTDIKLKFEGNIADNHVLDFYDAARAMAGFQRSLALTTHLVVNGEIITQAPALKEAEILVSTPAARSQSSGLVVLHGQRLKSSTGRLKALIVQKVERSITIDL